MMIIVNGISLLLMLAVIGWFWLWPARRKP